MFNYIKNLFHKRQYLNCHLMKHSLHFFHNEIRTCCANANGPVLYPDYNGENIDWDYVFKLRKSYIKRINSGECILEECKGCFEIQSSTSNKKIQKFENTVDKLYIQNYMPCNAKCFYCTFTDEEKTFKYRVLPLVKSLIDKSILAKDAYVFLSGGEITISPEFEDLLNLLSSYICKKIELATSGIKYSEAIKNSFKNNRLDMLLSLDSGSRETYKKIKKVDEFDTVISNLKKYTLETDFARESIILKYIILDGINDNKDELTKFFDIVKTLGIKQVRLDINSREYCLGRGKKVPPLYSELYNFFNSKAKELNLRVLSYEQIEQMLKQG